MLELYREESGWAIRPLFDAYVHPVKILQHTKLDILKPEISGKKRKFTEVDFQKGKIVPCRHAATGKVAKRK